MVGLFHGKSHLEMVVGYETSGYINQVPTDSAVPFRKYLVYDLGGQVPSQTVFGSIGSDTIHGHIQVIYQLMQNQLNPSDILMGASNGYFLRIQWKGYGDITTNKL